MKKLILLSEELALTEEEEKCYNDNKKHGFYPSDSWWDDHAVVITKEFPNNVFKEIKSREELYKFLRNRCKIDYIKEILEVPESLEALNIDERFIFCFNERVDFEISVGTDLYPGIVCLYTEEERKDILENGIELRRKYFNSTSTMAEYEEELKKTDEIRREKRRKMFENQ